MEQQEKLFTRGFVFGWFARFFNVTPFMMLMTTFASYCMTTYGCTTGEAGLAVGVFVLVATVVRLFAGRGVDLFGRRRSVIVSAILYLVCTVLYLLPMSYAGVLVLRAVHGAVFGWASTAVIMVTVDIVPRSRLGEGMGYYSLCNCIAFGQIIGVAVVQSFPSYMVFVVAIAFCVAYLAFCLALPVMEMEDILAAEAAAAESAAGEPGEPGEPAAPDTQAKPRFSLFYLLSRAALPLSAVVGISTVCYHSVTAFIEPFTTQISLGQFASAYFIVFSVVLVLVRPGMGKLFDKGYEKPIMVTSFILLAASYVLLGLSQNGVMLILSAVLQAIGISGANSNMLPIILKDLPRHEAGLATATFFLMIDAGTGLGPAIMGLVVQAMGYANMYVVDGAITVLLAAVYLLLRRKSHVRPQKSQESQESQGPQGRAV